MWYCARCDETLEDQFVDFWGNIDWQANFWTTLLGIGLGTWLLLGSAGLVQALRSLQKVELKQPVEAEP